MSQKIVKKKESRKKISKKTPFGRVIAMKEKDGRAYRLHATKGWRSERIAKTSSTT